MPNMKLPEHGHIAFSLDTGEEIGITLFRQPPLPPPHPPGSYPPKQMRRWWVSKERVTSYTLVDAVEEIKTLFDSKNTYVLQYYDGFNLMPVVNDRDLRSCLRYFLANSNRPDVCRIYLEETLSKTEESFKARIEVTAVRASCTKELSESFNDGSAQKEKLKRKTALTEEQRFKTFRARLLNKHGTNVEVLSKTTIKCLYDRCGKKISCKEFNQQNFDTHVKLCHASKKSHGSDIRLLLTLIGQSEEGATEEERNEASTQSSNADPGLQD